MLIEVKMYTAQPLQSNRLQCKGCGRRPALRSSVRHRARVMQPSRIEARLWETSNGTARLSALCLGAGDWSKADGHAEETILYDSAHKVSVAAAPLADDSCSKEPGM